MLKGVGHSFVRSAKRREQRARWLADVTPVTPAAPSLCYATTCNVADVRHALCMQCTMNAHQRSRLSGSDRWTTAPEAPNAMDYVHTGTGTAPQNSGAPLRTCDSTANAMSGRLSTRYAQ